MKVKRVLTLAQVAKVRNRLQFESTCDFMSEKCKISRQSFCIFNMYHFPRCETHPAQDWEESCRTSCICCRIVASEELSTKEPAKTQSNQLNISFLLEYSRISPVVQAFQVNNRLTKRFSFFVFQSASHSPCPFFHSYQPSKR